MAGVGADISSDPVAAQTFANEVTTRFQNLEGMSGAFEVKIAALEIGVAGQEDQRQRTETGINEAFRQIQEVQEAMRILNMEVILAIIDEKIKTATELHGKGGGKDDRGFQGFEFRKPILESKAINDLPELSEAKTYRDWNQRFKNAMEQIRPSV